MADETQGHDNKIAKMLAIVEAQTTETADEWALTNPDRAKQGQVDAANEEIAELQTALNELHCAVLVAYGRHTPVEALAVEYVRMRDEAEDYLANMQTLRRGGRNTGSAERDALIASGRRELALLALVEATRGSLL